MVSATCAWEGKKFSKEAKWKFVTNIQCFPPSPPTAPTPLAPLQPCSELAGVFLYKRPILWDARKAMEAFEGHHTKAQRQKGRLWYPDRFPNQLLWLHNKASGGARLRLSAHTETKAEKPRPPWGEIHTHVYTMNPCSCRLPVLVQSPSLPLCSHAVFMCTRALIHAFFFLK